MFIDAAKGRGLDLFLSVLFLGIFERIYALVVGEFTLHGIYRRVSVLSGEKDVVYFSLVDSIISIWKK